MYVEGFRQKKKKRKEIEGRRDEEKTKEESTREHGSNNGWIGGVRWEGVTGQVIWGHVSGGGSASWPVA